MKPNARRLSSLPPKKRVQNAPNRAKPHEAHARRPSTAATTPPLPRKGVPDIEIYQKEDCPYSHAVRAKLTELGLDFVAHTVPDDQPFKHERLVQAGGKDQIPFLIDRRSGVQLYNSGSIVSYLEHEYGTATPNPIIQLARNIDTRVRSRADRVAWRVRMPIERIAQVRDQLKSPAKRQELRGVVRDSVETLRGTYRAIRKAINGSRAA
ncbi:MAG: hypothetical protein A2X94_01315 [Bdellovibrionales bacterium GWB1_55_8]|nr:MAG: hypothetical protein A2X94_01315 [Bdellovibrionales bacterium GWB1_55_8]